MLYAAEALIEAAFTVAAINTKIALVETALGISITDVAARMNGLIDTPKDGTAFPLFAYYVGQDPAGFRLREFGKRDTAIPVRLLYLSRHTTLATAKSDIQGALEALQPIVETLYSTQHGSTARFCVDVQDAVLEFVTYKVSEEVVRHGGEMRFTMLMRTEG